MIRLIFGLALVAGVMGACKSTTPPGPNESKSITYLDEDSVPRFALSLTEGNLKLQCKEAATSECQPKSVGYDRYLGTLANLYDLPAAIVRLDVRANKDLENAMRLLNVTLPDAVKKYKSHFEEEKIPSEKHKALKTVYNIRFMFESGDIMTIYEGGVHDRNRMFHEALRAMEKTSGESAESVESEDGGDKGRHSPSEPS